MQSPDSTGERSLPGRDAVPAAECPDACTGDGIIDAELKLGELLFSSGAPGQRILDSIAVLNDKLHGGRLNVLLGFEALVITLERGGVRRTAMCGYSLPASLNGRAIQEISRYLRSVPDGASPPGVLRDLAALDLRRPSPTILTYAAMALFTVIFGYFNNADAGALLIIGIAALLAGVARELTGTRGFGYYLSILAATLVAMVSAAFLTLVVPTATPLVSLVIPCVFLIPGFQLINGGWEVLRNHMHIGIPRLVVYLNVLAIMGVGALAVLLVYNPATGTPGITYPVYSGILLDTLLGALAALCFCVLMNANRGVMLACILCGAAGRLVRTIVVDAGGNIAAGVFLGTVVITVLTLLIARYRTLLPVALPLVAASVQFIPGYNTIVTLHGMAKIISLGSPAPYDIVATTISSGILALFISAAIVMGTLLPLLVLGRDRRWY
jgi:uncharacterized membrane protein YjjB (DUF3815 family)